MAVRLVLGYEQTMDWSTVAWVCLACFLSGAVQGVTGFGLGIAAMGLLPLFMNIQAAVPFVAIVTTLACFATFKDYRKQVCWQEFKPLMIAIGVGLPVGILCLEFLPRNLIMRLLGAALLFACLQNLFVRNPRPFPAWSAMLFGAFSGILSGAFNVGGPPLLLYLQGRRLQPLALIATLHVLFAFSGLGRSIWALGSGAITQQLAILLLAALPAVVMGIRSGAALRQRFSERLMRYVLLGGICLLGIYYLGWA